MKRFFLFFLVSFQLFAKQDYFNFLNEYKDQLGPFGSAEQGEIEIIFDEEKIAEIESEIGRKIGIIHKDPYLIWINDPVLFPSGVYGVYGRVLWTKYLGQVGGVAVLPVLPNGDIALIKNFRHSTRTWEYEIPKGFVEKGETPLEGAKRELKEETGFEARDFIFLGNMVPDSGMSGCIVPIYCALVDSQGAFDHEDTEVIQQVKVIPIEELKQYLINGNIEDQGQLRDPFLTFALLHSMIRGIVE